MLCSVPAVVPVVVIVVVVEVFEAVVVCGRCVGGGTSDVVVLTDSVTLVFSVVVVIEGFVKEYAQPHNVDSQRNTTNAITIGLKFINRIMLPSPFTYPALSVSTTTFPATVHSLTEQRFRCSVFFVVYGIYESASTSPVTASISIV